jgi:hypothetical protein
MRALLYSLMLVVAACSKAWEPTALADGYQVMVMNSQEVYVANSESELILGPRIETIGLAPGVIVVNCGRDEVVINGFANTVGFNLIDTQTGQITKGLALSDVEVTLKSRDIPMPEMRALSSYLRKQ